MKERDRIFLGASALSVLASIIWLVILSLGYAASIPGDAEKILIATLQLDGILFGFGATLFSFLLKRTEGQITKWGFAYATTAFMSFFFSILFGFIGLLNGKYANPTPTLLSISFTLTGVLTIITFLTVAGSEKG